jgi:hypothetical protein
LAECYCIWSDQQIPYHDPRALSVATQIFADAKPLCLIYNGDWGDYMDIATHPKGSRDELYESLRGEVQRQREELKKAHKAIKPKRAVWNDGNHEFRVQRAFQRDPKLACKVLGLEFPESRLTSVKEAVSIPVLLGLGELGIRYSGTYPKGCWLRGVGLTPEEDVYVSHGTTARKKSAYTVSGQMDDHWSSMVIGHCERLALIWNRKLGRDYFGIEGGNLSLIGEPELGDDIYAGVPHSDPKLMNHRQGISVIYYDNGWHPVLIKIRDGKAWFNGRLYKA